MSFDLLFETVRHCRYCLRLRLVQHSVIRMVSARTHAVHRTEVLNFNKIDE